MAASQPEGTGPQALCRRCKEAPAALTLRIEPVCSECYCRFIATKTVKRLEVLDKETRGSVRGTTRNYVVGLSFGPSSSALIQICEGLLSAQQIKRRKESFALHVVHIDANLTISQDGASGTSSATQLLDRWRRRYPRFTFEVVPLASAVGLRSIDWSAFPPLLDGCEPAVQLHHLLESLPSTTSRADVLRLLVRHLLITLALQKAYDALLLGSSTTALAELTLAETAKGRGRSLPWQINDGPVTISDYAETGLSYGSQAGERSMEVYYPLRDVFRKEVVAYGTFVDPPLSELIVETPQKNGGAVVSHKDLSIEEVMLRYFEDVEQNYPSVVANVVRTTGKLERLGEGRSCGVCGMKLDQEGDERWKGEIGETKDRNAESGSTNRRCYGCERSING